jgi:hypothetical protein
VSEKVLATQDARPRNEGTRDANGAFTNNSLRIRVHRLVPDVTAQGALAILRHVLGSHWKSTDFLTHG